MSYLFASCARKWGAQFLVPSTKGVQRDRNKLYKNMRTERHRVIQRNNVAPSVFRMLDASLILILVLSHIHNGHGI